MALLREIEVRYKTSTIKRDVTNITLDSPAKVAETFSYLQFETKEHFIVVILNNQHEIMTFETVAIGTVNSASVRPIEVFRSAVILNAPAIVIIHNHSSGNPTLSNVDIQLTNK